MNRRNFLQYSAITSLLTTTGLFPANSNPAQPMPEFNSFSELVENLIKLNDKRVPELLEKQDKNPQSKYFGGLCDNFQVYNAGSTAGLITVLTCSFTQPKSEYYLKSNLADAMTLAAQYLLKIQHSDGTIDLLATNFHSTPDTGFVAEPLCACYKLLSEVQFEKKPQILNLIAAFLKNAGEAFIAGGVHTPNHRWVVSMALARINTLFPDERFVKRMNEWLSEGIDIDADGQYEEKSTYIYTPLSNRCLLTISKLAGKPELLDAVRKNLEMTAYYIHPNGEIVTEGSGRQDQFQIGYMENYYLALRYLAIHDKNPLFAAMIKQIEETAADKLGGYLVYFLEDNYYFNDCPAPSAIPEKYIKEFPKSKIVRIRNKNTDATLLAGNPTFFTLSKGKAVLASVRLASAFFGRGQFKSSTIEKSGKNFVMNWEFTWGYFQPFPAGQKPNYDIPFDEDRKRRKSSERQTLKAIVSITQNEGIFDLTFDLQGVENVPLAIEFAFRKGGLVENAEKINDVADSWLLSNGNAKFRIDNDEITIGPGKAEHRWTAIRGGLPKPEANCIYITGFTPFKHKVSIE